MIRLSYATLRYRNGYQIGRLNNRNKTQVYGYVRPEKKNDLRFEPVYAIEKTFNQMTTPYIIGRNSSARCSK